MTGLEHYREAERLLNDSPISPEVAAQVHATLALAAAAILAAPPNQNYAQNKRWGDWADMVGEQS